MITTHEVVALGTLDVLADAIIKLFPRASTVEMATMDQRTGAPQVLRADGETGGHLVALITPRGIVAIHRYRLPEPPSLVRVVADNVAIIPVPSARPPRFAEVAGSTLVKLLRTEFDFTYRPAD